MANKSHTVLWMEKELEYRQRGAELIAGVDEAGCGPLAGPVVAAAVILPAVSFAQPDFLMGLQDSKNLSEKKRELLFDIITSHCLYGIGIATSAEIDALNIRQADYLAMQRAVLDLPFQPDVLLVDAWHLSSWNKKQEGIPQGDAKIRSIAAASIVAKVTRDRILLALDAMYPAYGFAQHKGYPTKAHYAAIHEHGICKEHRKSFLKSVLTERNESS